MYLKLLKAFLGKSEVCDIIFLSGALDKSVFDRNTILLKVSEECCRHKYVYIGGNMICSFLIYNDNFYKCISNMGINLTPYSIAIGEENFYFLAPHFKFIKNNRIDDREILGTNENSVDTFDYHASIVKKKSFKKIMKV